MNSTSFNRFYETWLEQLHQLTTHLSRFLPGQPEDSPSSSSSDSSSRQLVDKAMAHYSDLYRAKSVASASDVLALFAAPWVTSLERSLHWVAGFRPTTVFHLLYTDSSAHVDSFIHGHRMGDMGELTAEQLTRVSELQVETVEAEDEISSRMWEWQEELAGMDWAVLALCCCGWDALEGRVEGLRRVVGDADELRIRTLSDVVEILSTRQAAQFLLAFSQVRFGIRSWGMQEDRRLPAPA